MIPASYLFKDTYRRHWEEPDAVPTVTENRARFLEGLYTPIAGAVVAVFHRRPNSAARHLAGPAYE